jgi:hypothetical protein
MNKTMWLFCIPAMIAMKSARAESTYTTNRDVIFTRVEYAKFGLAWKAPNGSIWSADQGKFTNKGKDNDLVNHLVRHSEATDACERIGGSLPTQKDFGELFSRFVVGGTFPLNLRDVMDLITLFPDLASKGVGIGLGWSWFWTSTITLEGFPHTIRGYLSYTEPAQEFNELHVRCIGRSVKAEQP